MPNAYQQSLLKQVDRSVGLGRFLGGEWEPGDCAQFGGLSGSARALVIGRIQQRTGRPVLVVTADAESAETWYDDLRHFGVAGLLHFPMTETLPYEREEPTYDIVAHQLATLYYLMRCDHADRTQPPPERGESQDWPPEPPLIVAPVEALQRRAPARDDFERLFLTIWWGERLDLAALTRHLVEMGYERQPMTEARGEFSVRGNIVDVFPPHFENPLRLDLFGDEIESIRFFEVATQRSIREGEEEIERAVLLPAKPIALTEALARRGRPLVGIDAWLPDETLAVLDGPEKFDATLERFDRMALRRYEELTVPGAAPDAPDFVAPEAPPAAAPPRNPCSATETAEPLPPERVFLNRHEVRQSLERFAQILLPRLDVDQGVGHDRRAHQVEFGVSSYDTIPSDLNAYLSLIKKKQAQDFSVHIVCDNEGQVTRLEELLAEHEIACRQVLPDSREASTFQARGLLEGYQEAVLTVGPMHTGFIFPDAQLLVVTDREMFGRYKRRHVYRRAYKGRPIATAADIVRGDLVVHTDHGIGRFLGIRKQDIDGRPTELLEIDYADGNKLLVPIENVRHVQKYASPGEAMPPLDRLGGKRWQTRKRKSQEKIEQMAEELLEIHARRAAADGFAFGADTIWQREFEDSFVYEETPDQVRAIEECKRDMTSSRPMDRLLCGDVGFGKTEVAMRAAFKAVEAKKQAAVLVPTTILAEQHYATFKERFADYPVRIEVISRFRTDLEQRQIIQGLKSGEVQIVIGTHRLLSQDVGFLDLGLLIVDEEHRFGVRQKEKIKAMRASVDILTLSATPIPRTLHMALSGLRDMSTINTPPRDRLPIRTRVIRFNLEEIEEAVVREMNRGGQVYFVHNRVQSIDRVARRLGEIVPRARIAIAHGQMPERELERVMLDFIDRKYDVLLSTTIIESGLDIPNVNTIIINRSDAFGLAQLYQLRGRVGRDVKRAYAYLIVPDGRPITDMAVKRLRAIEEFTGLGVGFLIAMRDLEIRGTGNILGPEQHGAIEAVGFELYCHLLEDAVRRLQGEARAADFPVEIRWNLPAFLPAEYVPVESQRLAFYKRCSSARSAGELHDLTEELRDRYGVIPREARNLIGVSLLRLEARRSGIEKIAATEKGLKVEARGDLFDFLRQALPLKEKRDDVREISAVGGRAVMIEIAGWNPKTGIEQGLGILKSIGDCG